MLLSHLRGQARWFAELWCLVAASVVSAYLAWYLYRLVYYSWLFQEHSEGADATLLWIPQTATVLGALVLVVCVVHRLVRVAVTGSVGKGAGGDG